jgi:hypothetical protein
MNAPPQFNKSHRQQTTPEEQTLYDYLLECVQQESPGRLLDNFRCLFLDGRGYHDFGIYSALEKIIKAKDAETNFPFFFNRCCHILINRWQMQPQLQGAIPELIGILQNVEPPRPGYYQVSGRLRQLVHNFIQTDQYSKLERIGRVISSKNSRYQTNSVGNLIQRYPYLYDHCLLGEDSSNEHQQTVRRLKRQMESNFEVKLSRYVTYKVRLAQINRSRGSSTDPRQIIRPVSNPTLLSDQELNKSLKQFIAKVEDGCTYKSLSENFLDHSVHTATFQAFKNDLYEYILGSVEPTYGKGQFNKKLYQLLQNTLPECHHQKPNEFLMLRTSSQLLNFLVVQSSHQPEHYVFVDLITNLGVTRTIGLLLKVVLVCQKIKPYLEKRFSILFNHYESFARDGVPWLVKAMENLQIAFSIHFGKADLSCLQEIQLKS